MRVFISHSSLDNLKTRAVKKWLVEQEPSLTNEIFLDLDGLLPGQEWKDALGLASNRCEAVICLSSTEWDKSGECIAEYRFTEYLKKKVFVGLLEPKTGAKTDAWQRCDLFVDGMPAGDTEVVRLDSGETVALAKKGLNDLLAGLGALGIGVAEYFPWPPQEVPKRLPYRGWATLDRHDAAIFFGRDAQIARGLDELRAMREPGAAESMLVILAPSGAGKSAFLRAGLLPRLLRDDRVYLPLDVVRPERAVLTADRGLAVAIDNLRTSLRLDGPDLGAIIEACRDGDVEQVRAWLEEARQTARSALLDPDPNLPPPTLVLPLDQAEELFTTTSRKEAASFLGIVASLLERRDGETPMMLLLATIRSDSYAPLQNAPELAKVTGTLFPDLKQMPSGQFREVITGPAEFVTSIGDRLVIDEALTEALLRDADKAEALPLLALTLEKLYRNYGGDGRLMLAEYEQMGGLKRIVQTVVDEILGADPDQRSANLEILHDAFVPALASINLENGKPGRRIVRLKDLPSESHALIGTFVENRLLVRKPRGGEVCIEIALESLLEQWQELAEWLRVESQDLKLAERVHFTAQAWHERGREDNDLALHGARLVEAEKLSDRKRYFRSWLSSSHDYLRACRRLENERLEKEQERQAVLKRVSIAAIAVALIAVIVAGFAVYYYRDANKSKTLADELRAKADTQFHVATAQRLLTEAKAMLAGALPDGDFPALQRILAAPHVSSAADQSLMFDTVVAQHNVRRIIQTNTGLTDLAVNHDRSRVASGSLDGKVRVWDPTTGLQLGDTIDADSQYVWSLVFAGHHIVTGGNKGAVRFWNPSTRQSTDFNISPAGMPIRSLAVSSDGRYVVAGSTDGTVRAWDALGAPVQLGPDLHVGGHGALQSVAINGDTVATGTQDGTIQRWDLRDKHSIGGPMQADGAAVWHLAFSPDGHRIAAGGASDDVWLWNTADARRIAIPHHDGVWTVAFNETGDRLATGGIDDEAWVWDISTDNVTGLPLTGNHDDVKSVAFLGNDVVTVGDDRTMRIWDGPFPLSPTKADGERVVSVAFPEHQAATVTADGSVQVWDGTGNPVGAAVDLDGTESAPTAFGGDGSTFAVATQHGTVESWSAKTRQPVRLRLDEARADITALAVGGNQIATLARGDDAIAMWDLTTGTPMDVRIAVDPDTISTITLSSDGQRLAALDGNGGLIVWKTADGTRLSNEAPRVDSDQNPDIGKRSKIAFSDDGGRIVSGARGDDRLREWDAVAGTRIGEVMRGHQRDVTSVGFDEDGRYLVSGAEDGTVRLWDANTRLPFGQPLKIAQPLRTGKPTAAISLFATSTAFSPDGQLIVAGLNDGTIRTWPGPAAWPVTLCNKLTRPINPEEWNAWVEQTIDFVPVCP